jgi:D-3-phosphoglycerate dehydrogenase
VDGIDIESPLGRHLLYIRNRDIPGVVGKVGTILGEAEVNIADFALGRSQAAAVATTGKSKHNAFAVGILHVDEAVPQRALEKLRKVEAIVEARTVVL